MRDPRKADVRSWRAATIAATVSGEVRRGWRCGREDASSSAGRDGSRCTVLGVVLHDGTPLKQVEVRADEGPWKVMIS